MKFRTLALRPERRANAQNVSFRISLRWPISTQLIKPNYLVIFVCNVLNTLDTFPTEVKKLIFDYVWTEVQNPMVKKSAFKVKKKES